MARISSTRDSTLPGVLVQLYAWGYIPLPADHPGVRKALGSILVPRTVHWDVLAEIAQLVGYGNAADDLIIAGGAAVSDILVGVRDKLVNAVAVRERERNR